MKQDNSGVSKFKYVAARNKFKSLVRQKKPRYRNALKEKLEKCKKCKNVNHLQNFGNLWSHVEIRGAVLIVLVVKNGRHIFLSY